MILIITVFSLVACLTDCRQRDKSKIIEQYKYDGEKGTLNVLYKKKLESWVKEGTICYGIVMVCDNNDLPIRLMEVHAKVVSIQPDGIKMESLEDLTVKKYVQCDKLSLKTGQYWMEVDGELFKTRVEAIKFIDENYPGLRLKRIFITK